MRCLACGAECRPGTRFCEECGARLDLACPACGARVPADKKFCGECGTAFGGGAPAGDTRFAAPSGYTPPHLAARILKDRGALEGERKQVTVLFADVSGFTSLSEGLDPEEVHGLMSRAFELMLAEVHRYEGTVNQFLGDGLMALFGAPVAHEDHARRAGLAALAMQQALAGWRAELARARGIDFRVRMGLNTGLVVVGAVGDNLRMDYTAVGDTTNVAARMQQMAEPGQIVVADPTRRLIQDHFELEALGPATLKNRREPVAAWLLRGARRAAAVHPLGRLLGREEALGALERALAAAGGGRGQVVYVVGEAGMGKSRLLLELRRGAGASVAWLEGRCLSFGHSVALLPILDALRQRFEIADTDGEAAVIDKIGRALAPLGERGAATAPYLRYALSVDPGDPAVAGMDAAERRVRLFRAIRQLLLLASRERPIALVVEDLHWIDGASEDFLRELVTDVAGAAIAVVLTYRPSYTAPFGEHTYTSRIVLQPLAEADARALVGATLGIENLPDDLAAVIARKAEGNPFFLEEIGRALVETGAVRRDGGRLRLVQPAAAIAVPDRVQDVIAARIDRLGEDQKRTVQIASVIGREFALRLLRRAADAADRVERALADLKALELVYERAAPQDVEYVFKHALTQDVAYESILHARRRELHARIGAAIEELYADRLDERAEELALHFTRGEVWAKTARYAREAGDRAAGLCLDARAVEFYERALDALGRLPAGAETARLGIDVRLALRAPLWRAGRLDRLTGLFAEAEALAKAHGEAARLDAVYAFFVQYYWAKGDQERALAYGERCLETAAARGDLGLAVTGDFYMGHARLAQGRCAAAVEHYLRVVALLEGGREAERFGLSGLPYSGSCAYAAWALGELGEADRALDLIRRGMRAAEAADHLYSKMPLAFAHGEVLALHGSPAEAVAILEPAAATCREKNFLGQAILVQTSLGLAHALAGRPEAGIPLIREAIEMQDKAGAFVHRAWHLHRLAHACLLAGRVDEAEAAARQALEFAARLRERGGEAWAWWVLGEVAARRGDAAGAARDVRAAAALAGELGLRLLAERCGASLERLAGGGAGA